MALKAQPRASCELADKSVVSRSSSGLAQVSNLGDIQITCGVPARPLPTKPGEFRKALEVATTVYQITLDVRKELVPSNVQGIGGGVDGRGQPERAVFSVHIPLDSEELDAEAQRYLAKMRSELENDTSAPPQLLATIRNIPVEKARILIRQHRVGHFLVECRVLDGDQVMGVGVVELEVLFKGRFSDALRGQPLF
jgi:hypothetical protein